MSFELIVKRGGPTVVTPAEEKGSNKGLYFLSNFDLYNYVYIPTVYCYKPAENKGTDDLFEVIKTALSKVLVPYYPVAGRLTVDTDGRPVLDCTGEGVVFVEAEATCTIEEIGFNTVAMDKLVYTPPDCQSALTGPILTAQVTKFSDGGFSLGLCANHIIFDGAAAMDFVNLWANFARGLPAQFTPFLDRTILRARNPPKIEFQHEEFPEFEDSSTTIDLYNEEMEDKFICFSPKMLERIKLEAMEDRTLAKCSTFYALCAFVWKARNKALKFSHDQMTKFVPIVDGRARFDPPMPEHYFGNGIAYTSCSSSVGDLVEKPLSYAVGLVQEAVKKVNESYLRSSIDYVEVEKPNLPAMATTMAVTSWTRLSFEETDFGWGQPFLTGRACSPQKQLVVFMNHPTEKGSVKVLIRLPAASMKIFEQLVQLCEEA